MSEENEREENRRGTAVQRMRSVPLAVKATVFLAVLFAALLPFVLDGRFANAAALAFVALIVLVAVVATLAELVYAGRTGSRGEGARFRPLRGLIAVAVTAGLMSIPFWIAFQDDSGHTNRARAGSQATEEQTQTTMKKLQHCDERSLTAGACIRRILGEDRGNKAAR
jgi:hypothetical protein